MSSSPPVFVSVYLTTDVAPGGGPVLFDIIETDGSTPGLYDPATGNFIAKISGWYDLSLGFLTIDPLTKLYIVKIG